MRPLSRDRPPRALGGATKRSWTLIHTKPIDNRIVAEVQ